MTYAQDKSFRNILFAVIVVIGVALSILISALSYHVDEKIMRAQFAEAAGNHYSAMKRELDSNLDVLESLQALYYASGKNVNRIEFRDFSNHILKQHASIQALEWIPRVQDSRREAYERAAQGEGFPDFQITERIAQGKMKRAEKRKEYFPVYFVEPYKGNEMAFGFDLASNPIRLEALEAAGKTGKMLATARITLVQEKQNQFGFIVFAPIYSKTALLNSDRARAGALEGFALGVFRINDIVEKATSYLKSEGVDFFIYDGSAPEKERFLYTHESHTHKTSLLNKEQPETGLRDTKTLDVAGRKWQIIYSATPDFIAARRSSRSWELLLAGLMLTSLIAGFLLSSVRHTEQAEKSAKNLSDVNANLAHEIMERKQAEKKITLFKNLIDRANDLILVVDPETGRFGDVNERACNALGYRREELLEMTALDIAAPIIPDLVSWRAHVDEVRDKGHIILEARQRRKDGTTFPVEVNVNYISLERSNYMVAIIRDITGRKKAEEAKRIIEEKFRNVVENIFKFVPEGLLVLTDKLNVFRRNKAFEDLVQLYAEKLNYTEEELKGIIIEQVKMRLASGDKSDISIHRKQK